MPVLDASALIDYLTGAPASAEVERALADTTPNWAPHLIDAEVGHSLRRRVVQGDLSMAAGLEALEVLRSLPLQRAAHAHLLDRAWELRENVSFYDGLYVALAELLALPLVTLDGRLAKAPGIRAEIVVVS